MIAALPDYEPPAIVQPAPVIEVKRRRNRDRNEQAQEPVETRPGWPAWLYVGAVIVLTDSDGNESLCTVAAVDYDAGLYWCAEDQ